MLKLVRLLWMCPMIIAGAHLLEAQELKARLIVSSTQLHVHDLVLAKVVVVNTGDKPVRLKRGFCNSCGTVSFQRVRPDAVALGQIDLPGQGLNCAIYRPREIPSQGSYVAYVRLVVDKTGTAVFREAGRFDLQAIVAVNGERIYSEPVAITLKEPPVIADSVFKTHAEAITLISASGTRIENGMGDPGMIAAYPQVGKWNQQIKDFEQALPESELKRTLQWSLAIGDLRNAKTSAEKERITATFQNLSTRLDPVSKEFAAYNAAWHYLQVKDFKRAEESLAMLSIASDDRDSLRAQIDYGREQEKMLDQKRKP